MRFDQLDYYGDSGELLKRTTSFGELPGFVKESQHLGPGRRPEHDHALILIHGAERFPLFPTADAGNTAVSAHYLVQNQDYLPEEAVKLAAANIGAACEAFGIGVPPDLLKLAEGSTEVQEPVFLVKQAENVGMMHHHRRAAPAAREWLTDLGTKASNSDIGTRLVNEVRGVPTLAAGKKAHFPAPGKPTPFAGASASETSTNTKVTGALSFLRGSPMPATSAPPKASTSPAPGAPSAPKTLTALPKTAQREGQESVFIVKQAYNSTRIRQDGEDRMRRAELAKEWLTRTGSEARNSNLGNKIFGKQTPSAAPSAAPAPTFWNARGKAPAPANQIPSVVDPRRMDWNEQNKLVDRTEEGKAWLTDLGSKVSKGNIGTRFVNEVRGVPTLDAGKKAYSPPPGKPFVGAAPTPSSVPKVTGAPAPPKGNTPPVLGIPTAPKTPAALPKTAAAVQVTSKLTTGGKVQAKMDNGNRLLASSNEPKSFVNLPKVKTVGQLKGPKLASYEHTKAAADWFNSDWRGVAPEERVKIAGALVDACEPMFIPLVDEAYVYARGVGDIGLTKVALRARFVLSGDPVYEELEKVAASCTTEEMVELIWEADMDTGLSRYWNSRIGDPFLSVMTKVASAETALLKGETSLVSPEAIQNLSTNGFQNVASVYGEDFAVQFRKRPVEVFKSLPDPNKELLARLANSLNE